VVYPDVVVAVGRALLLDADNCWATWQRSHRKRPSSGWRTMPGGSRSASRTYSPRLKGTDARIKIASDEPPNFGVAMLSNRAIAALERVKSCRAVSLLIGVIVRPRPARVSVIVRRLSPIAQFTNQRAATGTEARCSFPVPYSGASGSP
jgi:hypothetical protein